MLRPHFWDHYPLDELTKEEWEGLCDGCGQCCLIKLEDEDTGRIAYTQLACKLLDCGTGLCSNYGQRQEFVPDCIQLAPHMVSQLTWLPASCAYRRIHEGRGLASWHPLISGHRESVRHAGKSVAGRCRTEVGVDEEDWDRYIVRWVKQ